MHFTTIIVQKNDQKQKKTKKLCVCVSEGGGGEWGINIIVIVFRKMKFAIYWSKVFKILST